MQATNAETQRFVPIYISRITTLSLSEVQTLFVIGLPKLLTTEKNSLSTSQPDLVKAEKIGAISYFMSIEP